MLHAGGRWPYQRVSRQASLSDQSKAELSAQRALISTNFLELMENAAAFFARWLPAHDRYMRHLRQHVCCPEIVFVNAESSRRIPIFNTGVIRLRTGRRATTTCSHTDESGRPNVHRAAFDGRADHRRCTADSG